MDKIKTYYQTYKEKILIGLFILFIFIIASIFFISINNRNSSDSIIPINEKDETYETIWVDVKGMVNNPGVYELKEGSLVMDAIEIAGGLKEGAYTRYINLSKKLENGNVIIISDYNEIYDLINSDSISTISSNVITSVTCIENNDGCISEESIIKNETSSKSSQESNTKININTASLSELTSLDGIGESKAKSIIKYREENGNFKTIEEIKNVSGIGDKAFDKIKENITV